MSGGGSATDGGAGVYGKIPAQADFLRSNAGQFSRAGLDQWFQSGVEILHKEGTSLPSARTTFLLVPEAPGIVFIGAFVPSTDAVGRSFPLVVFAEVAAPRDAEHLASLLRRHGRFLNEAGALAESGAGLAGGELGSRAQLLALDGDAPDGGAWAHESARALLAALEGGSRALAYAMRTFVMACEQVAKADPGAPGSNIVVDAPAPTRSTAEMWLELARTQLPPGGERLSAFWTEGAGGRLMLALGGPPPALLAYLANPRHRASRLWPLRTEVESALVQAEQALTADQRQCLAKDGATLGELATLFARRG